jgi:hypothetical protein
VYWLGIGLVGLGAAGGLLRLAHVFRKSWQEPDRAVLAAFCRLRWGLLLLWLWRSWLVVSAGVAFGLRLVGVVPTWPAAWAWWWGGVLVAYGAEWLYQDLQARLEERRFEAFREHRRSIRRDLAAARDILPPVGAEPGQLARFERWLVVGELESAFDELAAAGEGRDCPAEFWRLLGQAAGKLGLVEEEEGIRRRLGLSADTGLPHGRT